MSIFLGNRKIDWDLFVRNYIRDQCHWYVSKAKVYSVKSYRDLQKALALLDNCFLDEESPEREKMEKFVVKDGLLFGKDFSAMEARQWNPETELYYTTRIDKEKLVSSENRSEIVLRNYKRILNETENGANYESLVRKFGKGIINDYSANARNFISMFKKLGFAWVEKRRAITVSEIGYKFMGATDVRPVLEKQLLKWQICNPTLNQRYRGMRIFPYIFLLKLLLKLKEKGLRPEVSRLEHTLFVTKGRRMEDLPLVYKYLTGFRKLEAKEKNRIRRLLGSKKRRGPSGKRNRRSVFEEIYDSAGKEISFLTSIDICKLGRVENSVGIILSDATRAKKLLGSVEDEPFFIEARSEEEWFNYYGNPSLGPNMDDAVSYYSSLGRYDDTESLAEEMKRRKKKISKESLNRAKRASVEKQLEDWYEEHVEAIEKGLKLVRDGRQYSTEIGPIDLLAKDSEGVFVVIELKKGLGADQVIGQSLRYMGWVVKNLARRGDLVRGIIVCEDVGQKLLHARQGMQHGKIDRLLKIKKHPPELKHLVQLLQKDFTTEEVGYAIK